LKNGNTSQLNLEAEYSILLEKRWLWNSRKTEYLDITKIYDTHWMSDNPNITTVYKGKLNGNHTGKTQIRVGYYGKQKSKHLEVE